MDQLQIIYIDPSKLTPNPKNARKHTDKDIDGVIKSIEHAGGFLDPIGIWGENNLIVEGHGRHLAAQKMGLKKVPCIRLDKLTEVQRDEYAIRHNRSAEMSVWDFEKLEEQLAALEINGIDIEDLGLKSNDVNIDNLDGFFADAEEKKEKDKKIQCPYCGEWFEP